MKKQLAVWVSLAVVAGLLAGCAPAEKEAAGAVSQGKIVSIDKDQNVLVLDHKEIPGVMMAMTMPFAVADPALLEGVEVGDAVEFTVEQRSTGLTVVAIEKIDPSKLEGLDDKSYEGKAKVEVVVPSQGTIMIRATDIPGISGEGKLVYEVRPPSLLEGIGEGDNVEIKLEDDGNAQGQLVVTHLKKIE